MERHDKMLSPEEQYAQLAPTLDADGFSLYAAAEEVTGLKVYEEFPYEDNHGMFEMADGHTLLRYLEAVYFGTVTWEIVPGTPYVNLCLAISAQAIAQRSMVMRKTHSDNELFTFRVWLVRLGLNGEEFKHTRDHLLANLDGDRAWRFDKDSYTVNQKKKKSREMER